MTDFLSSQQDYILFFYGTASVILAAACFVMKRMEGDEIPWFFLALYALLHGCYEWLEILKPLLEESLSFTTLSFLLRIASYLFLLEFGRSGMYRFVQGKAPGRWIFIPLLAMTALGGLMGGWAGFISAAKYFLSLPGELLASLVLLFAARRLKAFPRFLLMTCGLLMAFFALIGFASLVGNSLFKNDAIFRQLGLSSVLIRGSLSLGMAFTISLYSQISAETDRILHYFIHRSRYFFWICILSMVLIIAGGWMATHYLGNEARKNLVTLAHSHVETLNSQVHAVVTAVNEDVLTIAEDPGVIRSITTERNDFRRATAILDYYKSTRKGELGYLLDARGKVLASSNRRGHNSIVGQDFSRHYYVQQSLRGVTGNYPAFGLATEKRGFTASFPVYHEQEIVGIIAIKVSMDALDMDFERIPGFAFLVSPEGIVFLASHSDMVLTSLWPLTGEVIEKLATSRQFGAGPFKALLPEEPRDSRHIIFKGERYFFTRHMINDVELRGWSIVLFSPTDEIVFYRLFGIIVALSLSVLTISFFVGMEKSLESAAKVAVSENRFRTIFEGAPGAIFIVDKANRRILSANPYMVDWLGYTEKELLSMTLDQIRTEEGDSDSERLYQRRDGAISYVEEIRKEILFHKDDSMLIMAHDISDRKKAEELLYSLSISDGLTGIANRRRFDEFLEQEWRRSVREVTPLSLVMCDIDYFKNFNDTYGHLAGDDCLRKVAEAISNKLRRPGDLCARYGGEEFAVIMSMTEAEGALSMAESIRAAVEALAIPHNSSPLSAVITVSLGVATMTPQKGSSSNELIAAADQTLYQAKEGGRNQIRVYSSL